MLRISCLALFLSFIAIPTQAEYEFRKIVEVGNGFSVLDFDPSVNNAGLVSFVGTTNLGIRGVFTSDGLTTNTVADTQLDFFIGFGGTPLINSAGTVLFESNGWVKYEDGSYINVLPNVPHIITNPVTVTAMNDSGVAALTGRTLGDSRTAVAKADGHSIDILFKTDNFLWTTISAPSIDNTGRVAFQAQRSGVGSPETWAVFVDEGEGAELLVSNTEGYHYDSISLGDDGRIAYKVAKTGTTPYGVLHAPGEEPMEFARGNNLGRVMLTSTEKVGYQGADGSLLLGDTNAMERVIGIGDALLDSTVFSIGFHPAGFNDFGQFAFRALLEDGTNAIFLATEVATPEYSWNLPNGGFWNNATNWSPTGSPDADSIVIFGDALAAPSTVVIDDDLGAPLIRFDSPTSYNLAGVGKLRLVEPRSEPAISILQGDHQIQASLSIETDSTVYVEAGSSLSLNNQLLLNGNSLAKQGGGTLSINNEQVFTGGTVQVLEGVLGGTGVVDAWVINAGGIVSPGHSIGTLTILDSYEQDAGASLTIELAGTEEELIDTLIVNGQTRLSGTLEIVSLKETFSPTEGQDFTVLIGYGGIEGRFDSVVSDLAPLDDGLDWLVQYDESEVRLLVVDSGDFDRDGDHDGADFLEWQRGLTSEPLSPVSLAAWNQNYGSGNNSPAEVVQIPEPNTIWLMLTLSLLVSRRLT